MRPIPAPRIGDSHGLLRAIDERDRLRLDEFITEFAAEDLYPPGLENALGRTRQFLSFARAAGLCKEDRGIVEMTDVGRRYIRAGEAAAPFDVSPGQAEWLRRQLREKHMTDSIYHGLAISLSLLASSPGAPVATLDFGRALSYLGRAGWDNENTLEIQGERHVALLRDLELIDDERKLTATGSELKAELTLPVHMSLLDVAAQLNPGGADAVRAAGAAEWAAASEPPQTAAPEPAAPEASREEAVVDEDEYQDVGPGAWAEAGAEPQTAPAEPVAAPAEPVVAAPADPVAAPEPVASVAPPPPAAPAPPPDLWERADPDDATRAIPAVRPPAPADPRAGAPTVVAKPAFVAGSQIRAAAEARGLRLGEAVYANVAAALAGGSHVVLTGGPVSGKTELALAVAQAAVDAGKASGVTVLTSSDFKEIREAARRGRWVVVDDVTEQPAPAAFLARAQVTIDGEEIIAPDSWRVVATATTPPTLSRFAVVDVGGHPDLVAAIDEAAADPVAAAATRRLLPLRELTPLGAGTYLAAAAHAGARRNEQPADEATLAREIYTAYFAPHLTVHDDRAREIVG